jgi:co-chaperonin GroES (HSP10)
MIEDTQNSEVQPQEHPHHIGSVEYIPTPDASLELWGEDYMSANPDIYWSPDAVGFYPRRMKQLLLDECGQDEELPSAYFVLLKLPEVATKTKGGIFRPDSVIEADKFTRHVGKVVAFGPEAFRRKSLFPSGPRCRLGDWVIFHRYQDSRLTIQGVEYTIIDHEKIIKVVKDPATTDTTWGVIR